MKNKLHWKKRMITFAAAAVLTAGGAFYGSAGTAWATPASGTSVSDNIVVRESAVDGAQVGSLTEGQAVSIEGETTGSDGYTWYQITYTLNGTDRTGWVRGDLLSTSDDPLDADADTEETEAGDSSDEESISLVFETKSGSITLTDIPDEELALVSDRFTESGLEFAEGTITALQLTEPDELVSDDAAIVDFYYVYGYNEIGETGWYVYNVDEGTIQKSLLNMQYSISDTEDEESADSAMFSVDSLTRMMISALGVICLLLLILAIAFSVRYRRLRRILEDDLDEDEDEEPAEPVKKRAKKEESEPAPKKNKKKKKEEPEPAKVNKGQKPKEPVSAQQQAKKPAQREESDEEEPVQKEAFSPEDVYGQEERPSEKDTYEPQSAHSAGNEYGQSGEEVPEKKKRRARKQSADEAEVSAAEPMTEVMGVDIMDLDSMDDTDYEALLNRYLEENFAAEEIAAEESAAEKSVAEKSVAEKSAAEKSVAEKSVAEKSAAEKSVVEKSIAEDIAEENPDTGESDIIDLSKLRMPDEEPEFYDDDDDDDDLTFL